MTRNTKDPLLQRREDGKENPPDILALLGGFTSWREMNGF